MVIGLFAIELEGMIRASTGKWKRESFDNRVNCIPVCFQENYFLLKRMDLAVIQWKQYEYERNVYLCWYTSLLDYGDVLFQSCTSGHKCICFIALYFSTSFLVHAV